MPWWKVGNKYVDSLDDDYEEMNEAISAFRYLLQFSRIEVQSLVPHNKVHMSRVHVGLTFLCDG